ncbi:cell wall-binding repeat-containing protein [Clostridium sp. P21]|uniref:Cell wall-binding repeat-containing protein n=1 Tax=Clostridium muellerianum TaxID=2716538 RepID=A0A7Y0EH62_9CLOT|nr:cell wall-binding repeat-containing protein [Clostridium muellerianum]NMM63414.1 cell wall-binding repeat-containing protein [Clostridium muellerianum]
MREKGTRVLVSAVFMSIFFIVAFSAGLVRAASRSVTRIGEADKYATAAKAATTNWKTSDNIILVSGEGYADAISATSLAKKLDAPILLTAIGTLNTYTANAISTLKAKNIYIVGGNASISQDIRTGLKKNYNLIELSGNSRYETNATVAQKLVELGADCGDVIMVGGEGFSDAISVVPIAAAKGKILLLGNNNADSMKSVLNFISNNKSKVTVVGTKSVIDDKILNSFSGTRIDGGQNRFYTNLKVLKLFKDNIKVDKLYVANISGDEYTDALVASSLAGRTSSPLVLIDEQGISATTNAMAYIKAFATKKTDLTVIGGTNAISESTLNDINKALSACEAPTGELTVQLIEAVSLNQIEVHFNTEIDKDSSKNVTNYKIDDSQLTSADNYGKALDENSAVATALDNNTVLITLAKPRKQLDNVKVSVNKGILTLDKKNYVAGFEQNVLFYDITAPTLESVTSRGNNQITVKFSKAVNMKNVNSIKSKFKIDGLNIGSYAMNSDSDLTKIKNPMIAEEKNWSEKIVFYFDSPIKSGKHTLEVLDGYEDLLIDAAGISVKGESKNFIIDSNNTIPLIKYIKEAENGEVDIIFDRSMDVKTAKDKSNYEINGKKVSDIDGASISTCSGGTVVKLKHIMDGTIKAGSNIIYISSNVNDAYGNKLKDDSRISFEHPKNEIKPTVTKVTAIDSETIRVQFNKIVNYSYATSISNYELKDSKGVDITEHIDRIYNSKSETIKSNTDIYDIKLKKFNPSDSKDDWRLTGSKYNLTIKHIVDTENPSNMMKDYTDTLIGTDNIAPKVIGIYYRQNKFQGKDGVVVYFSEAMDSKTITNKDNYKFLNGEGDSNLLPKNASITPGGDNKSAVIQFPSSYKFKISVAGDSSINTGMSNDVVKILVFNVKDEAGNVLSGISYSDKIYVNTYGAQVRAKTIKVYYDGDDLKADVQFNRGIDNLTANDFTLGGISPTSANFSGDKVTLTFKYGYAATEDERKAAPVISFANGKTNNSKNTTKIDLIKAQGQKAYLGIKSNAKTTDETGAPVASLSDKAGNSQNTIYDYETAPKTISRYWSASRDGNSGKVYMTFDTVLDENSGIDTDDFMFTGSDGTNLKADSVRINGNTIIFTFNDASAFNNKIGISVKSASLSSSIRAQRDAVGNYANYVPSSNDIKERSVNVTF